VICDLHLRSSSERKGQKWVSDEMGMKCTWIAHNDPTRIKLSWFQTCGCFVTKVIQQGHCHSLSYGTWFGHGGNCCVWIEDRMVGTEIDIPFVISSLGPAGSLATFVFFVTTSAVGEAGEFECTCFPLLEGPRFVGSDMSSSEWLLLSLPPTTNALPLPFEFFPNNLLACRFYFVFTDWESDSRRPASICLAFQCEEQSWSSGCWTSKLSHSFWYHDTYHVLVRGFPFASLSHGSGRLARWLDMMLWPDALIVSYSAEVMSMPSSWHIQAARGGLDLLLVLMLTSGSVLQSLSSHKISCRYVDGWIAGWSFCWSRPWGAILWLGICESELLGEMDGSHKKFDARVAIWKLAMVSKSQCGNLEINVLLSHSIQLWWLDFWLKKWVLLMERTVHMGGVCKSLCHIWNSLV